MFGWLLNLYGQDQLIPDSRVGWANGLFGHPLGLGFRNRAETVQPSIICCENQNLVIFILRAGSATQMTPVKYVKFRDPAGPSKLTGSLEFMKAIAIWTKATMPETMKTDEIRVAKLFGLEALPIFLEVDMQRKDTTFLFKFAKQIKQHIHWGIEDSRTEMLRKASYKLFSDVRFLPCSLVHSISPQHLVAKRRKQWKS